MAWYDTPRTHFGPFIAWLENQEGAKDKSRLVKICLGACYLFNDEKPAGNGSWESLNGHPLGAHSADEKLALTAEIALIFGGVVEPALTVGRLPQTRAMSAAIQNMNLPNNPGNEAFVPQNRSPQNLLRAARKAILNGFGIHRTFNNPVHPELRDLCQSADASIQEWHNTFNSMLFERTDKSTQKVLSTLRGHQKMKFLGEKGLLIDKGGHEGGNFWLLTRAVDGQPVILISSKQEKEVKAKYTQVASGNSSGVGRQVTGTYTGNRDRRTYTFTVSGGTGQAWFQNLDIEKQKRILEAALVATGLQAPTVTVQ